MDIPAFPKPKQRKRRDDRSFITYRDGREVCRNTPAGQREYAARRKARWAMDNGICCLCDTFVPVEICTTEHPDGRGAGGGKRDDRVSMIRVSHPSGNLSKGSIRLDEYRKKSPEERKRLCGVDS